MIDYVAVLEHYRQPVPRYTSYPTAPQFKAELGQAVFAGGMESLHPDEPVSVYLHIPFCDRLCWFCGCHTKHTLKYAPVAKYVTMMARELELFAERFPVRLPLGHLHLGGGSPSLLRGDELSRLREALERAFVFGPGTEISVEFDPSDVENSAISALADFGTTRASIGVQDFDPEVQRAINRPQGFEITRDVIRQLRDAGIGSINIDALYGLPLQSRARLMRTTEQCISLHPDRMALFGYAHVPWLKKHQRLIRSEDLPGSVDRFEHSQSAAAALVSAGYEPVGIDHFAKPSDSLARAARSGSLRRNFQGYTTDPHPTMLGFGASSIGKFADGYVQNTVATRQYEAGVAAGRLPRDKGLWLSGEDRLRGHVIERLMCDFSFDFASLDDRDPVVRKACLEEARIFAASDRFGLCSMDGTRLVVEEGARPFTRIIASQFDAYYSHERFQYSKAV